MFPFYVPLPFYDMHTPPPTLTRIHLVFLKFDIVYASKTLRNENVCISSADIDIRFMLFNHCDGV